MSNTALRWKLRLGPAPTKCLTVYTYFLITPSLQDISNRQLGVWAVDDMVAWGGSAARCFALGGVRSRVVTVLSDKACLLRQ